jgi:hypothetical protein
MPHQMLYAQLQLRPQHEALSWVKGRSGTLHAPYLCPHRSRYGRLWSPHSPCPTLVQHSQPQSGSLFLAGAAHTRRGYLSRYMRIGTHRYTSKVGCSVEPLHVDGSRLADRTGYCLLCSDCLPACPPCHSTLPSGSGSLRPKWPCTCFPIALSRFLSALAFVLPSFHLPFPRSIRFHTCICSTPPTFKVLFPAPAYARVCQTSSLAALARQSLDRSIKQSPPLLRSPHPSPFRHKKVSPVTRQVTRWASLRLNASPPHHNHFVIAASATPDSSSGWLVLLLLIVASSCFEPRRRRTHLTTCRHRLRFSPVHTRIIA